MSNSGKHKPPSTKQLRHANRIVYRSSDGLFKTPPHTRQPSGPTISNRSDPQAELDQDPGGGYNPDGTYPQP